MCTLPAKCTGLFPWIGSQPAGSAKQKYWVSRPIRVKASSTSNPSTRFAASQVAPQGAPRSTSMQATLPLAISTAYSGVPNNSPYWPRPTCLERPHQVGGVKIPSTCSFLPEATTGIFLLLQATARSWERSACFKKSKIKSA